ncbi:hypothetical protein Avbf_15739 [Armadillidium vulgare]|nr:hypothetical protein Avbf_15739 [Armadillidium vulgare]
MKIDTEKRSLIEEKRHFQRTMENERRELERAKEYLLREQQILMQTVARQKSQLLDLETKKPKTNVVRYFFNINFTYM